MKKIIVRYKVKPNRVEENETLVKEVYKQLHTTQIEGFHYSTLKLADGVSFIHIAFADSEMANSEFTQLSAFKNFQAGIADRCDEPPVPGAVEIIGAYNFYSNENQETHE